VIFPCRQDGKIVNLYGRSIGAAFPHRLLPHSKGGLFAWDSVGRHPTIILVEGLFDSLRAYAYDLLHFARWWHPAGALADLNHSLLLDYVRAQLDQQPKPTAQTINHRLTVLRCLYRFHYGQEISRGPSDVPRAYSSPSPFSYGRPSCRRLTGSIKAAKNAHNTRFLRLARLGSAGRSVVLGDEMWG